MAQGKTVFAFFERHCKLPFPTDGYIQAPSYHWWIWYEHSVTLLVIRASQIYISKIFSFLVHRHTFHGWPAPIFNARKMMFQIPNWVFSISKIFHQLSLKLCLRPSLIWHVSILHLHLDSSSCNIMLSWILRNNRSSPHQLALHSTLQDALLCTVLSYLSPRRYLYCNLAHFRTRSNELYFPGSNLSRLMDATPYWGPS